MYIFGESATWSNVIADTKTHHLLLEVLGVVPSWQQTGANVGDVSIWTTNLIVSAIYAQAGSGYVTRGLKKHSNRNGIHIMICRGSS